MGRLTFGVVLSLVLLPGDSVAPRQQRTIATLVEAQAIPGCAAFDCPPWPMPVDVTVCLRVAETYYAAVYSPWRVPWARAGKKLIALTGQSVEIVVTDKDIRVAAPQVHARLKRMHNYRLFKIAACNNS